MKMPRWLPLTLLLLSLAAPALAATNELKTGAQLTYQVPLRDPDHPSANLTGANASETATLRAPSYGSYTLADVLAAMIQGITPGAIGAAPTVHVHAGIDITGSTTDGRALLTGTKAMQKIALEIDQVNNTSDLAKPISTATQAALDGKLPLDMTGVNAAAARAALGLGTASTAATGYGIGQVPLLVDVGNCSTPGVCSDGAYATQSACDGAAATWTPYDSPALCTTNGATWTAVAGLKFSSADFPKGALTQDGVSVPTVEDIAWAALPDKPPTFEPSPHQHDQTEITGLVARLVALEDQVTQLSADLSLAGYPSLIIDQPSPVTFTTTSTTLTGTYADNGSVTALEYNIDGGAWANITPLQSPWSLEVTGGSLTPNVASAINIRATDDTALARTKSVSLTYQTPVLSMTPTSWDFGSVDLGQVSATKTFTLTNSGQATSATLTTAKTGTDAAQFDITLDTCDGQTLAPSASCAVTMAYSPDAAAVHSGGLSVGGQSVSLSGTGQIPLAVNDDFSTNTAANYTYAGAAGRALTVADGVASGQENFVTNRAIHTTTTGNDNHYVQARVMVSPTVSSDSSGVILRSSGATGTATGYSTSFNFSSQRLNLNRFSGDTNTAITYWSPLPVTITEGVAYSIKISVSGNVFTAYIDGNDDGDFDDAGENLGTKTDSTYATGGYIGVLLDRDGGGSPTVDNLIGSAL